jgi:hypothetical protein
MIQDQEEWLHLSDPSHGFSVLSPVSSADLLGLLFCFEKQEASVKKFRTLVSDQDKNICWVKHVFSARRRSCAGASGFNF